MPNKENKLALPGWKNEPRYSNKVLVGNWLEERLIFTKGQLTSNSTNRIDFGIPKIGTTDNLTRRRLAKRNYEGVGPNNLLAHHGKAYISTTKTSNYKLSYDCPSTRRDYPLRYWNSHLKSWIPERLDVVLDSGNDADKETEKTGTSLPPIHIPNNNEGRIVMKYRHRKTDIAPYFPVILRTLGDKRSFVVNLQNPHN